MARRTKAEAQETREQILDAAERVFHVKGVSGTSLSDIATEAGVTRGAIYWHFRNKHDVFIAMMQRGCVHGEQLLESATDPDEMDPLGRLEQVMRELLEEIMLNPERRRLFEIAFLRCEYTAESLPLLSHRRENFHRFSHNIALALSRARDLGQLGEHFNVPLAVTQFHTQMMGLLMVWVMLPEQFNLYEQGSALVSSFIYSLKHCPAMNTPRQTSELLAL